MDTLRRHLVSVSLYLLIGIHIGVTISYFLSLRPNPPMITIAYVDMARLDLAMPNCVTSTFVLSATVANLGEGRMVFDRILVVVKYEGFPITVPTAIPRLSLDPREKDFYPRIWVFGIGIPLRPEMVNLLSDDLTKESLFFNAAIDAELQWKLGGWPTKAYKLSASCPLHLIGNYTSRKVVACSVYLH